MESKWTILFFFLWNIAVFIIKDLSVHIINIILFNFNFMSPGNL